MANPVGILLISGSLRAGSASTALLSTVPEVVDPAAVAAQVYFGMGALPHFNPDDDYDPVHAAVADLRARIAAADALVFSTPEYAGSLPGSFKNLLDWTVGGNEIVGKPTAWIDVAAPGRGGGAHAALRTVLGYTGADIVEDACVRIAVPRQDVDAESGSISAVGSRAELADAVARLAAYAEAAGRTGTPAAAADLPGA